MSSQLEKSNRLFNETVIFFDWDDTCFPSTFLGSNGFGLDTSMDLLGADLAQSLQELETCVVGLLEFAMQCGTVIIVTNAEKGWVELSAKKYMPGLSGILSHLQVVSARTTFEASFPHSPLKWKFYAFQQILADRFAAVEKRSNVISLGDSHAEREAIRAVTRGHLNTTCKSVKFAERPSTGQLLRQIQLISNSFQYIVNHDGELDLQLTITTNPDGNEGQDAEDESGGENDMGADDVWDDFSEPEN